MLNRLGDVMIGNIHNELKKRYNERSTLLDFF